MSGKSLDVLKHEAWQAIAKHERYDEHADGCGEDEGTRLYVEADEALDAIWLSGRDSVVCDKCKLDAVMAKREAEGMQGMIGERIENARAELEAAVSETGKKRPPTIYILELISKLMIAVRMGNAP